MKPIAICKKGSLVLLLAGMHTTLLAQQKITAAQLMQKVTHAAGQVKTLHYTSELFSLNSGRTDSTDHFKAKVWLTKVPEDTVFQAHFHLQQQSKQGYSDYYYDGINGMDIWHSSPHKELNKSITLIEPATLPNGVNQVLARVSLLPYSKEIIDTAWAGWKKHLDSMQVTDTDAGYAITWKIISQKANAQTNFELVIDKKLWLIKGFKQFTTWNGVRINTTLSISNIRINNKADAQEVLLARNFPGYAVSYERRPDDQPQTPYPSLVGKTAGYDFGFSALSARQASFKGSKLLLLDFWESWCGYCILAIPKLKTLHEKYQPQGLNIIGIVTENKEQIAKLVKNNDLPYATVLADKKVLTLYNVQARPRYILINDKGIIVADDSNLEPIEKYIAGQLATN